MKLHEIDFDTAESDSDDLVDSYDSDESSGEMEDATSIRAIDSSQSDGSSSGASNVVSEKFHGLILYPLVDGSIVRIGIFEVDASGLEHFSEDHKNFDIV
ncbi:hypothetical protein E8E11_004294 [Didymella keratinophila]|nr:hypothetical protein E8E11_004294 [Didymella keratinophila]